MAELHVAKTSMITVNVISLKMWEGISREVGCISQFLMRLTFRQSVHITISFLSTPRFIAARWSVSQVELLQRRHIDGKVLAYTLLVCFDFLYDDDFKEYCEEFP